MTKKDIARAISRRSGVTASQALEIVQGVLDCISDALAAGGRVELRNFGVFEVKRRKARKARNPHTGGSVAVPEKRVVVLKPGKELQARVGQSRSAGPG